MTGKTLVTGGAGFVGKHLVQLLRDAGERVISFDLASPSHDDDLQGSVTDVDAIAAAMRDVSSVFHLAGNAQLWARSEKSFEAVNTDGARIVGQAALDAGVQRFVHCSSLTTLVGRTTPIGRSSADEKTQTEAGDMLGAYPRSKWLADAMIDDLVKRGLNASIGIPTEPIGAGDASLTPPTQMILDFANGDTPAYINCMLNFVPVRDLAAGLVAVRDKGACGERYILGGENVSMTRLLGLIGAHTRRKMPATKLPYWVALMAGVIDTKAIAAITGKPPKAPLTGVRLAGRRVSFSSEKAALSLDWQAGPAAPAIRETIDWFHDSGLLT